MLDFVEQHVQRGTGDAVAVGLTGFPDDDDADDDGDVLVLPGDTPLLRPVDGRRARARAPRRAAPPARSSPARLDDPTGYGRVVPRQGRPGGPHRRAGRRHAPRSARSTRSTRRSTASAVSVLAPALRRLQPRERAGRVLPDRRRRGAARRRLPGRRRRGRRRRRDRRASTTGCSWPRPRPSCGAARTTRGSARASRWSTRAAPTSTPPCELAPDVTLFPGTILQGAHGRRSRARDRSRHAAGRLHRRRRRRRRPVDRPRRRDRRRRASSVRTRCSSPGASMPDGAVTGPFYTALGPTTGLDRRDRGRLDAGARHQEEAAACTPAAATRRWPRTSPRTSASSSASRTSGRSPTASRTAASASRSAAPTSSSSRPTAARVNDSIMEQLDHDRRRQAGVGQAHHRGLPAYGYSRQDRKAEGREPIAAKLVADLLTAAGRRPDRVGRPALRSDPGLLRRAGRPPHRRCPCCSTT